LADATEELRESLAFSELRRKNRALLTGLLGSSAGDRLEVGGAKTKGLK